MQNLINQLKALSDTNRFRIVMMLKERPLCVCELLEALEIAGGTLSNHLKVLKNAGLINQKKDGRWIEYGLSDEKARKMILEMEESLTDRKRIEEDRDVISKINRTVCSSAVKNSTL